MLRILATRRWLGFLALAILFAVAAFYLGQWQWGRFEVKAARADLINAHYDAPPGPPGALSPALGTAPLDPSQEWTRIEVEGTYAEQPPLLVRNRPLDGIYGYEVLAVLRSPDLAAPLLVDRGWVQNAENAASLPQVPSTPSGQVTVTGWLRSGEIDLGRNLPTGQLASINLAQASAQSGSPLVGAYLILEVERDEAGEAPERPEPLEAPDTGTGPHQAYAFQWWGAMPVGLLLVGFAIRREAAEGGPAGPVDASGGPPEGDGEPAAVPVPVPARARKVRIWDEEDDD